MGQTQPLDVPPTPLRDVSPDEFVAQVGADGTGTRDLLIYLHVPFCSSKCHFCDFVADLSVPDLTSGPGMRAQYVAALCRQVSEYGPRLTGLGYRPQVVYWGGGTPSRLSADELGQILATLAASFDLTTVTEHSVEASPETLTEEKVRRLRGGGANRISIGVQSFVPAELRRTGRAHSVEDAVAAAGAVRRGGIANLNIDLIAGMPGQPLADMRHSVRGCVELEPTHVTVYPYRADPRTVLARQVGRGDRPPVAVTQLLDALELSRALLDEAGYAEYAVGHFARPGYRFLGESYYFELRGDYVGFGSGAGSSVGHHKASNSHRTLHRYCTDPLPFESMERFSPHNLGIYAKDLRLAVLGWSGIDRDRFERLYGYPLAVLEAMPIFRGYLDYFRGLGGTVVEDEQGIRLAGPSQLTVQLRSYVESPDFAYRPGARGPGLPLGVPTARQRADGQT